MRNNGLLQALSTNKLAKNPFKSIKNKDLKSSNPLMSSSTIGILSFEVANAMSKAILLYNSLSDTQISILHDQLLNSIFITTLVSTSESYLLNLVLAEKLEGLNRVATVVSRLGKRCKEPALVGFQHVYADLLKGHADGVGKLTFFFKDMDRTVKKMERYVISTANLYGGLGVLNEMEQGVMKFQSAQHHKETRRAFEQKIQWQRHDVWHLRNTSLWNQNYDKIIGLMARVVCTIYARICIVFGESSSPPPPPSTSQISISRPLRPEEGADVRRTPSGLWRCGGIGSGRILTDCISFRSSTSCEDMDASYLRINTDSSTNSRHCMDGGGISGRYGPKSKVTMQAETTTIGGSGLSLHYANIIIIMEKFLRYPHLVGEDASGELYQMLPSSLRTALRRNLRSSAAKKNTKGNEIATMYDSPLEAHIWKESIEDIMSWLGPPAHNMIRWQTERSFEQHRGAKRINNVLLVETLFFADREKTEAAICDVLVGLNYICRCEHQQNRLSDCRSSSADFDDWQLQY